MGDRHSDDLAPTEGLHTRSDLAAGAPEGTLPSGTVLGRYRIETLIGRGGMGEVYRAAQLEPVRRTVALKRLHLRRLDARNLARFEVERQLLAHMRHPAIAQVYDAGTTPDGRPFLVMEFIEGSPVTEYCEQHGLSLRERLALFIRVCEGVQHAHQKGVVHRDLKPGNILVGEVDGRPLPRIIDFGIATAADRDSSVDRAGTPDYMSPEQAGLDGSVEIDTRSDVYSLGVLLYELIVGQRPGTSMSTGEAMHTVEATPVPPSRRLETLPPGAAETRARQLQLRRPHLQRALRGELDWAVLKAMRRDRGQRYASASALAADLQRFLDGRPLEAVPPSRRYVWGKLFARHRFGVAAAAAVTLAVLAGLALSLYGLHQANVQRGIAERRSEELEKVAAFQQSMLEGVDIEAMGLGLADGMREQLQHNAPETLPLLEQVLASTSPADLARQAVDRHVLANALAAIERDFGDQPELAADLRLSVAGVQQALGMPAQAAEVAAAVAAYRERSLGNRAPGTLDARNAWAQALLEAGDNAQAQALAAETRERTAALPPGDDQRTGAERTWALATFSLGDRDAARELQQTVYERERAVRADDDPMLLNLRGDLGLTLARMGDIAEARELYEDLYRHTMASQGAEAGRTLVVMGRLAVMRDMDGDAEAAVELQSERVALGIRKQGAEHPAILNERANLGNMLLAARRFDEAEALMREVLAARERLLGAEHPQTLRTRLNLATLMARSDRAGEALVLERQVLLARRRILGPRHPDTVFIETNHALTMHRANRPAAEVLPQMERAGELAHEVLGDRHPQTAAIDRVYGLALLRAGRLPEALARLSRVREERRASLQPGEHPDALLGWALSEALLRSGRADEARAILASDVQWLHDIPADQRSPQERNAIDVLAEERRLLQAALQG